MAVILRWVSIIIIVILQLASFGFFSKGFFPKKVVMKGKGEYFEPRPPDPPFKKLIFVVIDALRSDFMFSEASNMPIVHGLINSGLAMGFTAHSTPPTVTLPRIKGLTTGSTPNFLDAILNIAESDTSSTLLGQDSWVLQLKEQGSKLYMYGDDTWIKLFPGMFDKTDGTASFFVADFTEVDNNVTRHIDASLSIDNSWDVLILHYLGLDHIGHKGGPQSSFMPGKQSEMDSIIGQLYQSLSNDSLLVVCGDHGMNEAGNHGGSSQGETSAAMLLASPLFKTLNLDQSSPLPISSSYNYYERIQQTDLVPTLAALLGFPIPKNSLGVTLKNVLGLWKEDERINVLKQNVRQMELILQASSQDNEELKRLAEKLSQSFDEENAFKVSKR